jgi:hypothetical protein
MGRPAVPEAPRRGLVEVRCVNQRWIASAQRFGPCNQLLARVESVRGQLWCRRCGTLIDVDIVCGTLEARGTLS